MIDFLKRNWTTLAIAFATLVLAAIAIFTAMRLYQLRQQVVAPNVPTSQPQAQTETTCSEEGETCGGFAGTQCCGGLVCRINAGSSGVCVDEGVNRTRSACNLSFVLAATSTATASPTASPAQSPSPSPTVTSGPTSSPTPSPTSAPAPTPTEPSLPASGVSLPTVLVTGIGIILVIFGVLALGF